MTLFKYWVTSPHVRLDTDVLYRIMDFAKSVQTSDRMRELAQEVMEAIDVQVRHLFVHAYWPFRRITW